MKKTLGKLPPANPEQFSPPENLESGALLHDAQEPTAAELDYWNIQINEEKAAEFIDGSTRLLQKLRQVGGGPRYYRLTPRCIRYTRRDLREWVAARARTSTSE